jgi:hypothetical protein
MTNMQSTEKRSEYVTLIAVHRFLVAGLGLIGAIAIAVFGMLPVILTVQEPMPLTVSLAALAFGALLCVALAIASLVVGVGLLRLRSWARWAEIVLAVLGLASFPIGTAIGILVLLYLLSDAGRGMFEAQ